MTGAKQRHKKTVQPQCSSPGSDSGKVNFPLIFYCGVMALNYSATLQGETK